MCHLFYCVYKNQLALQLFNLPEAHIVIHCLLSGSPTMTAVAPLFCMARTLLINEHPPLLTSAIQSVHGGSTTLHPVGSETGSAKKPNFPLGDILGPNAAIRS